MKIKTSELEGKPLNWAVAKCMNQPITISNSGLWVNQYRPWNPSKNWQQAGPIIEQEIINIQFYRWDEKDNALPVYQAWPEYKQNNRLGDECVGKGHTHLVAAMRCFVMSKMGEEIDIPEELL